MKIAIVGASGLVGQMMLTKLAEENIEADVDLFASVKSAGKVLLHRGQTLVIKELTRAVCVKQYDYVLFSAGSDVSRMYVPLFARARTMVIDNSAAWRQETDIPLVIPEINGHLLNESPQIVANPNCSTIQLLLAIYPLHQLFGLKKLIVSTYQSVSGAGQAGIDALGQEALGKKYVQSVFGQPINANLIAQIGDMTADAYSSEEIKMKQETYKILANHDIKIVCTAVRVPVMNGHAESVYAEFKDDVNIDEAINALKNAASVKYDTHNTSPLEVFHSDMSHVARVRSGADSQSLVFWSVANNIRVGAATNAVRILLKHEELKKR